MKTFNAYGMSEAQQARQQIQARAGSSGDLIGSPELERLFGDDFSDVKVHYNSHKPAQLNALAFAQGRDIHVGPGHEVHLPHEAWHVIQQKQGKINP